MAGVDRRGFWTNHPIFGTRIRVGEVSMEMAMALAEQGNMPAARQAAAKPRLGLWFSKEF